MRSYAGALLEKLDKLIERAEHDFIRRNMLYQRKIISADSTGVAADTLNPPPGVDWLILRVAVTGGANGQVAFYLNEAQPQNLIDGSFSNAAMDAWAPTGGGLYIPQGNTLVIRFFNQPVAQVCTCNFKIDEIYQNE